MVHAELIHNPYLLQTTVKFNGQSPRINSQIEKYEKMTLKDWVEKIPQIFYDEMNGFDFDFNFSGTSADFEEVKKVFEKAGISKELVRLFHKNELENVEIKSSEIDDLLQWLVDTPNRKFDYPKFKANYTEIFDSVYPYIVIRGNSPESIHTQIGIERISNAAELDNTLLTSTPILFFIDEESGKQFREDLRRLLKRKDVQKNQLFFMIHPQLKKDQITRVISDLGVEKPQIVLKYDAEQIMKYFQYYPMTEYVREAIQIFEEEAKKISQILEKENEESVKANASVHAELERLEKKLTGLKEVDEYFVNRDNFMKPIEFQDAQYSLTEQIQKWRNRKTKLTGDYEAEIAAGEYDVEISKWMNEFNQNIQNAYRKVASEIMESFNEKYKTQGLDLDFIPKDITLAMPVVCISIPVIQELIALKKITYEVPKTDFIEKFWKNSSKEEKAPVRVATCYYEEWRNKVLELELPFVEKCIEDNYNRLNEFYNALAEKYHLHIEELIAGETVKKEHVSAQLSDDERKLQEDNDWLQNFKDQLTRIEGR